ncbi:MAG: hypothetical protein M0021_03390 [Clostridia bacterium]|nr:hypothetical protein [Clostridia bacterium]
MKANGANKIAEYENIIRHIKDVVSARIVANEAGEILEVHVLARQNRGPKQLVRDIESAVMAQFGVAIDHKKISVAQMQQESSEGQINEVRPRLVKVDLIITGVSAEAKVDLRIGEEIFEGKAGGPSATNNRLRLIVQATLGALEHYLRGTCTFAVEDVLLAHLGRQEAAVVSLSLVTLIGEEYLIGSAFVKGDEWESIVKATLNAINRRLSLLVKE